MKFRCLFTLFFFTSIGLSQNAHIVCHDTSDDGSALCPENTGFHFRSIQEAINAVCIEDENGNQPSNCVADGDTILVEPGTYYENLIIQRDLHIVSRFAYGKTEEEMIEDWYEDLTKTPKGYAVNSDITNTIINGSRDTNAEDCDEEGVAPPCGFPEDKYTSSILYNTPPGNGDQFERGIVSGSFLGFTITGGRGTTVLSNGDQFERAQSTHTKGGGVYMNNSLPIMGFNAIHGNGDQFERGAPGFSRTVNRGGGMALGNGDQFERGGGRYNALEALSPSQLYALHSSPHRPTDFELNFTVTFDEEGNANESGWGNSFTSDPFEDSGELDWDSESDDGSDDEVDDGTPPPLLAQQLNIRVRGLVVPVRGNPANMPMGGGRPTDFSFVPGPDMEGGFNNFFVEDPDFPAIGNQEAIYTDVYVALDGSDEIRLEEEGPGGTFDDPFRTVEHAMAMILPTDGSPITIHIGEGIYQNEDVVENGEIVVDTESEVFPIFMHDNINLMGAGETETILDPQNHTKGIVFENSNNNVISDLTVRHGQSTDESDFDYPRGGGIYVNSSSVDFENVTIDSSAAFDGGGIYFLTSTSSLRNVKINENTAVQDGGGICLFGSVVTISDNSIITANEATGAFPGEDGGEIIFGSGGGVKADATSRLVMADTELSGNNSRYGSALYIANGSSSDLLSVNITDNTITDFINDNSTPYGYIVSAVNADINLTNVAIIDNSYENNSCGNCTALNMQFDSNVNIENSISNNPDLSFEISLDFLSAGTGLPMLTIDYTHIEGGGIYTRLVYGGGTGSWSFGNPSILDYYAEPNPFSAGIGNISTLEGNTYTDSANPNHWYKGFDENGSDNINNGTNDIGPYGGSLVLPSALNFNLGNVGTGNTGEFSIIRNYDLYNFRSEPLIFEVSFQNTDGTPSDKFSTNQSTFEIAPHSMGSIPIIPTASDFNSIEGTMVINSAGEEPIDGAEVNLFSQGVDGTVLTGELAGEYSGLQYIHGDLIVDHDVVVTIAPGSQFLFMGEYEFIVNGVLIAEGVEGNPIVFDNDPLSDTRWRGFTLNNQNSQTVFRHVRISGGHKFKGGGIKLVNSTPTMEYVEISGNYADAGGGGILVEGGFGLTLSHMIIQDNYSALSSQVEGSSGIGAGGGVAIELTYDVMIENSKIVNNTSYIMEGGGLYIERCEDVTLQNVEVTGNSAHMGGGLCSAQSSGLNIINSTISNNQSKTGGGLYIYETEDATMTNSILWNNTSLPDTDGDGIGDAINAFVLAGEQELEINYTNSDAGCVDKTQENGDEFYFSNLSNVGCDYFAFYWDDCDEEDSSLCADDGTVWTQYSDVCDNYFNVEGEVGSPTEMCCACGGGQSTAVSHFGGSENKNVDPQFVGGDDYSLQAPNELINAGTALLIIDGEAIVDIPESSYYGSNPDMGCYEHYEAEVLGDVNADGQLDVLDLVMIVYFILDPEGNELTPGEEAAADADGNEGINVQDIVYLINIIFNQMGRTSDMIAEDISIYRSLKGLHIETDAFIALDIEISHLPDFDYSLTNEAFIAVGHTDDNTTRLIIAEPYSDILFNTDDEYEITNVTAVAINGEVLNVNLIEMPTMFSLSPAYPNPFNPVAKLDFSLPLDSDVVINVYDINGRLVDTLIDGFMDIGYHSVIWNATTHASGMYFVKMKSESFLQVQKLMLVK